MKPLFEIHAVEVGEGTGGGIGYQSNEGHCRRTASYLSKHTPSLYFICSLSENGTLWHSFAYFYLGHEISAEDSEKLLLQENKTL